MFVELFAPMGEIVEQKGTSCRLLVLTPLKSSSFEIRIYLLFPQTKFWDGYVFEDLYAPQTKILEGLTIVVVV